MTLLRILLCFALALASTAADASVPGRVTFTARMVDDGTPLAGSVQIKLDLFRAQTGGTSVWSETHAATAVDGLVSLAMGDQIPFAKPVLDGPLFLEVTVGSTLLTPRLAINSVPFALLAERAEKVGDLAADDIQRRITGTCPTGSSIRAIDLAGTVTCEADDDHTFGVGLLDNGGTVTVDPSVVQSRITGSCPTGSSISAIGVDGSVTCEVDDSVQPTAGFGITISPTNEISANLNLVQRRVAGFCLAGSSVRVINADGSVTCEADTDTNTTYQAACPNNSFVRTLTTGGQATCGDVVASQAFTLTAANSTTQQTLALGSHGFCALTRVQGINTNDPECRIVLSGATWTLVADGSSGIGSIVTCEARCL